MLDQSVQVGAHLLQSHKRGDPVYCMNCREMWRPQERLALGQRGVQGRG